MTQQETLDFRISGAVAVFVNTSVYITHRIHGAAIYGNMDPINIPQMLYIYIYVYHTLVGIRPWLLVLTGDFYGIIEGSLEVKLPTIWTDEKQRRAEAERRGRLEERRSEEKE